MEFQQVTTTQIRNLDLNLCINQWFVYFNGKLNVKIVFQYLVTFKKEKKKGIKGKLFLLN